MRLTDVSIRQFPNPEKGQVKLRDDALPGFGMVVGRRTKSFFVMYGKARHTRTLGRYPDLTLKEARSAAKRLLSQPPPIKRSVSFSEARDEFLADCALRLRKSTTDRYSYALKPLSASKLDTFKTDAVDPTTIKALKTFYNWCVDQGHTDKNPFLRRKVVFPPRDRVLSDDELRAVWQYSYPPYSDYLKFLILTGCRKGECIHFQDDGRVISIDGAYTKNHRTHTFPLTQAIRSVMPLKPFNGWSRAKERLDRYVDIPHWTLHDLRRTFATNHARLGTPIHVVEAMLNHSSGSISGVAAIYIRHQFLEEARAAQRNYEDWLCSLVSL